MSTHRILPRLLMLAAALALLAGCEPRKRERTPEEVRAALLRLLPAKLADRRGWAEDIRVAFAALHVKPSNENLCAALAVTEQESGYVADPVVPGLSRIATQEIIRRAGKYGVPEFAVRAALKLDSPNGESYEKRLAKVRTERELSEIFEALIASIPMGRRLLARANPVHTGGPMQVSIGFAENFARRHDYPWGEIASVRHEVFTRRGGMYFGIAHLLGYRTSYDRKIYRFADYNAGFHASRNAAFQAAVARVSGTPLPLDGDLVAWGSKKPGTTELAVRAIAYQLEMDEKRIARELRRSRKDGFEDTELWRRTFELADRLAGQPLPRARIPVIRLHSPKITRQLTTEWFAKRVDTRYRRCLAK
jgi:hypothetical protein